MKINLELEEKFRDKLKSMLEVLSDIVYDAPYVKQYIVSITFYLLSIKQVWFKNDAEDFIKKLERFFKYYKDYTGIINAFSIYDIENKIIVEINLNKPTIGYFSFTIPYKTLSESEFKDFENNMFKEQ